MVNPAPLIINIQTNLSCNLRCTYCYEDFDGSTLSVEKAVEYTKVCVKQYLETGIYPKEVVISVIGGEPLMKLDLLSEIWENCSREVLDLSPLSKLTFEISTNFTMITKKKVKDFILKYQDYISIRGSLDGNREGNSQRVKVNGKESFDDIIESINWLKNNTSIGSKNIHITTVITKSRLYNLYESLKFLIDLNIGGVKFNVDNSEQYSKSESSVIALSFIKAIDYYFKIGCTSDLLGFIDKKKRKKTGITVLEPYNKNTDYGCSVFKPLDNTMEGATLATNGNVYSCLKFTSKDKYKGLTKGGIDSIRLEPDVNFHSVISDVCKQCIFVSVCDKCIVEEFGKIERLNNLSDLDPMEIKYRLSNNMPCNITQAIQIAAKYAELKELLNEKFTN